jgi:protein-L-isoaspartate(D-aspartate) O-methyltransferase
MFSLFGGGAAAAADSPPPARHTQAGLVHHLVAQRLLGTPRVIDAFRHVDRGAYAGRGDECYEDRPLPIGAGQTISAPHMHAMCVEALERRLAPGARVLDVGAGSGYLTAVFAKLVGPAGFVLGVEKEADLAARSIYAIARANPEVLFSTGRDGGPGDDGPPGSPRGGPPSGRMGTPPAAAGSPPSSSSAEAALSPAAAAAAAAAAAIAAGTGPPGRASGVRIVHGNVLDPNGPLKGEAPFDAIHVGAAADELHAALLAALAPGGRMVVPVGPRYGGQELTIVDKDRATGRVLLPPRRVTTVSYVPLTKPGEADDGLTDAEARRFARLMRAQEREDEMHAARAGEETAAEQERHRRHEHARRHQHQHRRRDDDQEM